MEWYLALLLLLGTVCAAMFLGLPVAFAFFGANVLGTYLFLSGDIGLVLMPMEFHNAIKFTLAPIPLFLLMGEILLQTGVAFKAINAIDRMIARVPGRLSVVSIVGGTIFSSLSRFDDRQHGDSRLGAAPGHGEAQGTGRTSPWARSWPSAASPCSSRRRPSRCCWRASPSSRSRSSS